MMLSQLVERVEGLTLEGDGTVAINGVTHDSRQVEPGALFVALPGRNIDGLRFVPAALEKGARALGIHTDADITTSVPVLRMDEPRRTLALIAAEIYEQPAHAMSTIGVTGTNGKTTVATMVADICRAAGRIGGQIGTNGHRIGDRVLPAAFTTPEAPDL
jgi:UDP-N-acetylmuramyl tripeptide synthase